MRYLSMDVEFADSSNNNNGGRGGAVTSKRNFTYTRVPRKQVCKYWKQGRCIKENNCEFLHSENAESSHRNSNNNNSINSNGGGFSLKRSHHVNSDETLNQGRQQQNQQQGQVPRRNVAAKWGRGRGGVSARVSGGLSPVVAVEEKEKVGVCEYWIEGNCRYGDGCRNLHSFVYGCKDFQLLTQLVGHNKAIRAITPPSASGVLYSGGQDKKVTAWNCQTGEGKDIPLDSDVWCILCEGPWLFVGITNTVKAWNTLTSMELTLEGPKGEVNALAVGNGMLLAGSQDGHIFAWRFSPQVNAFQAERALIGHSKSVVSLAVKGTDRLYSGSVDNTIKVWDLSSFQCLQTLSDHTSVVMSLLCWDQFLLSGSLDGTVKVWVIGQIGALEVTYTHKEDQGVLALCGMNDHQDKPVLLCSCNDSSVRFYDLPSFTERGRIFSRTEVRVVQIGPEGLFFTGDGMGELKVWRWVAATQNS